MMKKVKDRKEELTTQAEELAKNIQQGQEQIARMQGDLIATNGAIAVLNELEQDSENGVAKKGKAESVKN